MSTEARQIASLTTELGVSEATAEQMIAAGLGTTAMVIEAGAAVWATWEVDSAVAVRLARRPEAQ
jgi:hypothetical protein